MLQKNVLFWYAEELAARHQGEKRSFLAKALEDPSFIKMIEFSLPKDMRKASRELGVFVLRNKNTSKEIFYFLKFYFWSDETPVKVF